ncbi:hypothetical protein ACOJQI_20615 [Bacillus salacetis]|uniref:hypothetical protein n=1 Tax=Bacillus salacetis TaxID=2315464 RepID=UPI003BA03143
MLSLRGGLLRKGLELSIAIAIIFSVEFFLGWDFDFWKSSLFLFLILLFSIQYGWKTGGASLATVMIYEVVMTWIKGSDVLLLFYDLDQAKWLMLYLVAFTVSGIFGTKFKERYNDLQDEFNDLEKESMTLKETVDVLEASRKTLVSKIYEYENTPARLFDLMKSIHSDNYEGIMGNMMDTLTEYFQTNDVRLYEMDRRSHSLKIKYKTKETDRNDDHILTGNSPFFKRLLTQKSVILRNSSDEENVPQIAGVISQNEEVTGVLAMNKVSLERLNPYELELLQTLLLWVSYCQEQISQSKEMVKESKKVYSNI